MYINFEPLTNLTQKKAQFGFIIGDQTLSQDLLDSFFSTPHGAVLQNAGLSPTSPPGGPWASVLGRNGGGCQ